MVGAFCMKVVDVFPYAATTHQRYRRVNGQTDRQTDQSNFVLPGTCIARQSITVNSRLLYGWQLQQLLVPGEREKSSGIDWFCDTEGNALVLATSIVIFDSSSFMLWVTSPSPFVFFPALSLSGGCSQWRTGRFLIGEKHVWTIKKLT